MTDNSETLVRHADTAFEAIRALNHGTYRTLPAPTIYALLGNLQSAAGSGLAQLLGQMADGLTRSLTEYDVYDNNRDPAESVALATEAMREAAHHAQALGRLLSEAQSAISMQGYYNVPDEEGA
jgi:hypothetical protein